MIKIYRTAIVVLAIIASFFLITYIGYVLNNILNIKCNHLIEYFLIGISTIIDIFFILFICWLLFNLMFKNIGVFRYIKTGKFKENEEK